MKNFLTGDGFILVPRVTTTERNALTATNGMLVYDTTLNKFYFYENSAWVNVGGGNSYSRTVINGNTTAANDTDYTLVSSSTITDPTPEEGKGYTVLIRNGTATIGGTGYSTAGQLLFRVYHSGAWVTYQLTTQAQLNDKADKSNTTLSSYLEIPEQSKPATPTNAIRFFIDSSNRLSWIGENGYVRTFDGTANTADRVYTLPDSNGTIALSVNPLTDFNIQDDFIGYVGAVAAAGSTVIYTTSLHTIQRQASFSLASTATANRAGIVTLTSTTNTLGTSYIATGSITNGTDSGTFTLTEYFQLTALSTATKRYNFVAGLGLIQTYTQLTSAGGYGAFIHYRDDLTSGKFRCINSNNGVTTVTDSGITVAANTWYKLTIVATSSQILFYINDSLVATNATNIPASALSGFTSMETTTNSFNNCGFAVDYIQYQKTAISR